MLTEFDKDVLGGVEDDLLEVLAHQDLDWVLVPVFRNVLAHKVRLWTKMRVTQTKEIITPTSEQSRVNRGKRENDVHLQLALCERCAEGDYVLGCDL